MLGFNDDGIVELTRLIVFQNVDPIQLCAWRSGFYEIADFESSKSRADGYNATSEYCCQQGDVR
jgi:hypothetical protein